MCWSIRALTSRISLSILLRTIHRRCDKKSLEKYLSWWISRLYSSVRSIVDFLLLFFFNSFFLLFFFLGRERAMTSSDEPSFWRLDSFSLALPLNNNQWGLLKPFSHWRIPFSYFVYPSFGFCRAVHLTLLLLDRGICACCVRNSREQSKSKMSRRLALGK